MKGVTTLFGKRQQKEIADAGVDIAGCPRLIAANERRKSLNIFWGKVPRICKTRVEFLQILLSLSVILLVGIPISIRDFVLKLKFFNYFLEFLKDVTI